MANTELYNPNPNDEVLHATWRYIGEDNLDLYRLGMLVDRKQVSAGSNPNTRKALMNYLLGRQTYPMVRILTTPGVKTSEVQICQIGDTGYFSDNWLMDREGKIYAFDNDHPVSTSSGVEYVTQNCTYRFLKYVNASELNDNEYLQPFPGTTVDDFVIKTDSTHIYYYGHVMRYFPEVSHGFNVDKVSVLAVPHVVTKKHMITTGRNITVIFSSDELRSFNDILRTDILESVNCDKLTVEQISELCEVLLDVVPDDNIEEAMVTKKRALEMVNDSIEERLSNDATLIDGYIVGTDVKQYSEEELVAFDEMFQIFFQQYADEIAKLGGIFVGDAAAYILDQSTGPFEYVSIYCHDNYLHLVEKLFSDWECSTETISYGDIETYYTRKYMPDVRIFSTFSNPRSVVSEFSLSTDKIIYDPAPGKKFGYTHPSVIDDVKNKRMVFLEKSSDISEEVSTDTTLSAKISKRIIDYLSRGYRLTVSEKSRYTPEALTNEINLSENSCSELYHNHYMYTTSMRYNKFGTVLSHLYNCTYHDDRTVEHKFAQRVIDAIRAKLSVDDFVLVNINALIVNEPVFYG